MQIFPALPEPPFTSLAFFIKDHRINPRQCRASTTGLHRIDGRLVLQRKPPVSVCHHVSTMTASPLTHNLVVPLPDCGLNWFAHSRHVLEVIIVFCGFVRPGFAQHTDRCGRSMKDVHVQAFGYAPRPPCVGIIRHALIQHAGCRQRQRPVNDVEWPVIQPISAMHQ